MNTIFKVDGKPFFPFGGQSTNSAAYTPEELGTFWRTLESLKGNTAEIPIYWEQIEPQEGQFNFAMVDTLIKQAREKKVKLILLWFATWKNGTMQYVPAWVKRNPDRFKRVITHDGVLLPVLSSHCPANFDADCKAFRAVMEHIRRVDEREGTVIAMQVQNEPGIAGRSCRDHGPEAEKEFLSPVPSGLLEAVKNKPGSPVHAVWWDSGAKPEGNWPEVFGREASEFFSSWSIAKYIDGIAAAGKKIHDIPMYINVWLHIAGWRQPGPNYPAGGAVPKTLDIWKWTAPSLDVIAPDIYLGNPGQYCYCCEAYKREDNPLFIPESDSRLGLLNDLNMFYAIGKYDAIGYFLFGIENMVLEDGMPKPQSVNHFGNFKVLSAVLPLIIKYHGTGRIHPVVQEESMSEQLLDLEEYNGLASFGYVRTDYRHRLPHITRERGRGLVIRGEKGEFFVVGGGFTLDLRKKYTEIDFAEDRPARLGNYLSVEEGYFDEDGNWVCDRKRNGDERDGGVWVYTDVGVVRIVMFD